MAEVAPAGAKEVDQRPNRHDPFWDSQQDVLKTYSFNYQAIIEYNHKLHVSEMIGCWVLVPLTAMTFLPFATGSLCMYRCAEDNIRDKASARHIALTKDGIRYIVDKHQTECRLASQMQGRTSQTIPYDKISDCDVEEPAGAEGCPCYLVERTMDELTVATSTSRFTLTGLDAPYELKKDVWSMKRGQGIESVDMDAVAAVAPAVASMDRSGGGQGIVVGTDGGQGIGGGNSERLLAQILQCLKEQNSILAQLKK